jgi:hypothetical protein
MLLLLGEIRSWLSSQRYVLRAPSSIQSDEFRRRYHMMITISPASSLFPHSRIVVLGSSSSSSVSHYLRHRIRADCRLLPNSTSRYPLQPNRARYTRTSPIRPRPERIYSLLDLDHPSILPSSTRRCSSIRSTDDYTAHTVQTRESINQDREAECSYHHHYQRC